MYNDSSKKTQFTFFLNLIVPADTISGMRKQKIKTADLGRNKHEFLVRLPQVRYEKLSQIAQKNAASLNYQVNEAIQAMLIQAGLEQAKNV